MWMSSIKFKSFWRAKRQPRITEIVAKRHFRAMTLKWHRSFFICIGNLLTFLSIISSFFASFSRALILIIRFSVIKKNFYCEKCTKVDARLGVPSFKSESHAIYDIRSGDRSMILINFYCVRSERTSMCDWSERMGGDATAGSTGASVLLNAPTIYVKYQLAEHNNHKRWLNPADRQIDMRCNSWESMDVDALKRH